MKKTTLSISIGLLLGAIALVVLSSWPPVRAHASATPTVFYGIAPSGSSYNSPTVANSGEMFISDGGKSTTAVAAGTSADTVIKASAGRLCKVLITTSGSNALVIWDNASGHTGTIIGDIAASASVGTLVSFNIPAANGITVQGNASNPAFTVSYE